MKRIFLTGFAALFLFAVQAQTKTTKKSTKMSTAAKSKAAMAQKEQERQDAIEEQRVDLLRSDSVRRSNDMMADSSFAMQQTMWKDSMNHMQDSTYADRYKTIGTQQEEWAKLDRNRDAINKAANLSTNQGRLVKNINQSFTEKAKVITDDATMSDDQKKTQLATLNTERMAKIKAGIGSGKAKKLEKERKAYIQKNGADTEQSWIDMAEAPMATTK